MRLAPGPPGRGVRAPGARRTNPGLAYFPGINYSQNDYSHPGDMDDTTSGLPLKPIELMILTVLAAGDRHGYGIRQDILEQSEGQVAVEAGSLYRHLRALEDEGFVSEVPAPRGDSDERRIYYRLTPGGRRVLAAEMRRLREIGRASCRERV